jgi:hypothetical protein
MTLIGLSVYTSFCGNVNTRLHNKKSFIASATFSETKRLIPVSYTQHRAHETPEHRV